MNNNVIYWAVLAQLAIPFWVLILNGLRKSADRKAGRTNPESHINNKAWSEPVILTSNSLDNQFQFPIVFYVLCLVLAQINGVTLVSLVLAWLFVMTRWLHALVHVTSNRVPVRSSLFIVSMLILLVLFVYTLAALMSL